MKIIEWFKNLLSKTKKNHMLNEGSVSENIKLDKNKEFISKVNINNNEHKKSREEVIKTMKDDIIIEDLSEEYNYAKFSPENIKEKYDKDSVLSEEDVTALSCLYGAIKEGNMWHSTSEMINHEPKLTKNKINDFLKQSSNNIVILINLMENNAKNLYESLEDEKIPSKTIEGLIPGSYGDISQLIEEYIKESEIGER